MSDVRKTINNQTFEQDSEKDQINFQKHRIRFDVAVNVFKDKNRLDQFDEEHSDEENRYITIGRVKEILFVVYTEREDATRLISARRANKEERRLLTVKEIL